MADFYAENPLIFDVPNDNPFYADPAAVFVKTGEALIGHPTHPPVFSKQSVSELVHPSSTYMFPKYAPLSTVMERSRNAAG